MALGFCLLQKFSLLILASERAVRFKTKSNGIGDSKARERIELYVTCHVTSDLTLVGDSVRYKKKEEEKKFNPFESQFPAYSK